MHAGCRVPAAVALGRFVPGWMAHVRGERQRGEGCKVLRAALSPSSAFGSCLFQAPPMAFQSRCPSQLSAADFGCDKVPSLSGSNISHRPAMQEDMKRLVPVAPG